jgi:hypothetical protein
LEALPVTLGFVIRAYRGDPSILNEDEAILDGLAISQHEIEVADKACADGFLRL